MDNTNGNNSHNLKYGNYIASEIEQDLTKIYALTNLAFISNLFHMFGMSIQDASHIFLEFVTHEPIETECYGS